MMDEKLVKKYEELQEKGTVLVSRVKLTKHDPILDTDIIMLDLDGVMAIILREELDIREITTSLVNFVGLKVKFKVMEIDRESGVIICSRKAVKEEERDAMLARLEDGEVVTATIDKLLKFGAYVNIEGVTALLRNEDFAEDYTSVSEVLKEKDTIKVKLRKVSESKKIFVQAETKYTNPSVMNLDTFKPEDVVFGVVRNVQPFGAFVCIGPNIDALCPVPPNFEIERGMNVSFKINNVIPEEGRVRGKIIRVIPD